MKTANIIKPEVKGAYEMMGKKALSDKAEKWAKDLFEEMTERLNFSQEEALLKLRQSPFFRKDWVV